MRNSILKLLVICSSVVLLFSCKKDPNPAKSIPLDYHQGTGRCRLSRIDYHLSANPTKTVPVVITYDEHGRIASCSNAGAFDITLYGVFSTFQYKGDTIIAMHGGNSGNDTVVLNERKQIAYWFPPSPPRQQFLYDQSYRPIGIRALNSTGITEYFRWENDDVVADSIYLGDPLNINYYPDKLSQFGSPFTLMTFATFGVPFYISKHLPHINSSAIGHDNTFTYAFDNDGKIIADTVKSGTAMLYYNTFTYECN